MGLSEKKRIERVRYLVKQANDGFVTTQLHDELVMLISWECLTCSHSILKKGKCNTKTTRVPCLYYEKIKEEVKQ